jgi:membrane-bound metal-dependent hydrolase YbcI (DUF457 family)
LNGDQVNAINHAATALLIKKRWPSVPIVACLVSVQLIELLWVAFNLLGIERTEIEPRVRALNDIHLVYMPFSHSLATTLLIAASAWLVLARLFKRPGWATAIAVGICSHIVLDVVTHVRDIEVIPFLPWLKIGSGLYALPALALVAETLYGVYCWWIFDGSKALLAVIVGFNLAALSFYVPQIAGPETLLAQQPGIFPVAILAHIVLTLAAVGYLAHRAARKRHAATHGIDPDRAGPNASDSDSF